MSTGAQIVADFVSALENSPGLSIVRSTISHNVWIIGGSTHCLIYVKGRTAAPYRWGIIANVVHRLEAQNRKWFAVLLYESKETGYLLSAIDVRHYIKVAWPRGIDGDYKPAPGTNLAHNHPFSSFSECVCALRDGVR